MPDSDPISKLSPQQTADLCALADGSIADDRRAAVEAWVASDAALGRALEQQRRAVALTRSVAEEPLPASLRELLANAGAEEAAPGPAPAPEAPVGARRQRPFARRRPFLPRLAPALGVAAAVAVALAVWSPWSSGGEPTVAHAAQLAARGADRPAPAATGVQLTQLAVAVGDVEFPNWHAAFGWRAAGLRRDRMDGRDTTTVFYARDGRRLAYTIVAGRALAEPRGARAVNYDGVHISTLKVGGTSVVTWRRDGRTCVLSGTAAPDEMLALASWRGGGTLRY